MVAVGFTFDPAAGVARVITFAPSKARNVAASPGPGPRSARWTAVGTSRLRARPPMTDDPDRVAVAVAAYGARYRQPKDRDDRVVIEIQVDRILGQRLTSAHPGPGSGSVDVGGEGSGGGRGPR